jgi:hypothetical protein
VGYAVDARGIRLGAERPELLAALPEEIQVELRINQ